MNNGTMLFALMFLLLSGGTIDVTQMLIFLSLVSYTCGLNFGCTGSNTAAAAT